MSKDTIHVVGGGPVGALTSIFLARRGYGVSLFERRPDPRRSTLAAGRSINLAVTSRGLKALGEVGLRDEVLSMAIPMKGRMLHDPAGRTTFVRYGQKEHEVIHSVSRGDLNRLLLSRAEDHSGVSIAFGKRCTGYDVATRTLKFEDEAVGREHAVPAPVVLGTDGSSSVLRKVLGAHAPGFASSENQLEYDYKELHIAAAPNNDFRMEPNALHIWPRKSFMLIALPNRDGSFTGTLFYPHAGEASFESLTTPETVTEFFEREFPDAAAMMPDLVEVYFANPTGVMVTVKCAPWRIGGQLLLLGDAAHAIVPFFGQGMNCGFEDASRLGELLDAAGGNWGSLFGELEAARKPNTDAIAAMALENFVEMRDTVADAKFQLKKQIGFALEQRYPGCFIPKYAMVVFHPEISYSAARILGEKQDTMLTALAAGISEVGEVDWTLADRLMGEFVASA